MLLSDQRGQAHALEAFTAALLLLAGLLFALQATAVTPLSASTSNQHLENQQRAMAADLLAATEHTGALEEAVLNWSGGGFGENTNTTVLRGPGVLSLERDSTYTNPANISRFGPFGDRLNETLLDEGSSINLYVIYENEAGVERWTPIIFMGTPSDNSVVATRTVVLTDGDRVINGTTIGSGTGTYFAPDRSKDDPLYTVLEVRIVVWQN